MDRRAFLRSAGAVAAGMAVPARAAANVPVHNFDKYDFGSGPSVADLLYQGPFSADEYPSWNVVMTTTPSSEVVPNFGMGMMTYICDEVGPPVKAGQSQASLIEELVRLPLGNKLYLRVNWKDVQQRPGRLDLAEHWKTTFDLARRY